MNYTQCMVNKNSYLMRLLNSRISTEHRNIIYLFLLYFTLTFNNFYKMQRQVTSIHDGYTLYPRKQIHAECKQ